MQEQSSRSNHLFMKKWKDEARGKKARFQHAAGHVQQSKVCSSSAYYLLNKLYAYLVFIQVSLKTQQGVCEFKQQIHFLLCGCQDRVGTCHPV